MHYTKCTKLRSHPCNFPYILGFFPPQMFCYAGKSCRRSMLYNLLKMPQGSWSFCYALWVNSTLVGHLLKSVCPKHSLVFTSVAGASIVAVQHSRVGHPRPLIARESLKGLGAPAMPQYCVAVNCQDMQWREFLVDCIAKHAGAVFCVAAGSRFFSVNNSFWKKAVVSF